jgi:sec-independent protein translocase protein TatA
MGSMSLWHWIVVILVVLLLFGRGKLSELMGDVAKGIKSFKKGMAEDDDAKPAAPAPAEPAKTLDPKTLDPKTIDHQAARSAPAASQPVEPGKAN